VKITAAVARERSGPFALEELDLEEPRDDEVAVRICGAGICHTDLAMRAGRVPLPVVLGHEGAGIVQAVGARVAKVRPGDHVVLSFLSCGSCGTCQRGMPSYCENGLACNFAAARLDGSSSLSARDWACAIVPRSHGNIKRDTRQTTRLPRLSGPRESFVPSDIAQHRSVCPAMGASALATRWHRRGSVVSLFSSPQSK
jgi:hypothetical protein